MLNFCKNLVFLCIIVVALSAHLPSDFGTCKISDDECLSMEMENALTKLADGNKGLGVPSIDPFVIDLVVVPARPSPISISQKYTNILFYGISRTKIPKFRINLEECAIYFEATMPNLNITTHFALDGQLLLYPINTEGDLVAEHDVLKTVNNVTCEKYEKNGSEYLRFVDVKVEFIWSHISFNWQNVTKENQQIEHLKNIFRDDPLALIDSFRPELIKIWGSSVSSVANRLFDQVPLSEIFKD